MDKRVLHTGKWLSFGEIDATALSGKQLTWEFATPAGTTNGPDCMIALNNRISPTSIVLVKQFRQPIEAAILVQPARLASLGQSPEEAVLRELRKETVYLGTVISQGPPVFSILQN
jgi:ADP-ribose pyrophosphatase